MLSVAAAVKVVRKAADQGSRTGDPWPAALRILTRRDHSCAELRNRLKDRGYESELIEETLSRCLDLGYLDDERFATNRAASLMNQGRAVGYRVLQDLKQRGVSDDIAAQALAKAQETFDENRLLAGLLEKRFPDFCYSSAPAREKRRVISFLQRRGLQLGFRYGLFDSERQHNRR